MTEEKLQLQAIDVSLKIKNILLDDFNTVAIGKKETELLDTNKFNFEFNVNGKVHIAEKSMVITCTTSIFSDETKKLLLGNINTSGTFEITNIDELMNKYKGVPNVVIASLIGIVLSTTRGMLILKSQGTIIENALLPVLNPLSFFPGLINPNK